MNWVDVVMENETLKMQTLNKIWTKVFGNLDLIESFVI